MKVNEVTKSCAEFALKLDTFVSDVRRHSNIRFISNLRRLHRAHRRPYDGEVAKEAIRHGVRRALPKIGVVATFDPAP